MEADRSILILCHLKFYLRWIKEWICSERLITICAIVKTWLCLGSRIWPKCDITRLQRLMRALVLYTLQRNLSTNMHRTQLVGYSSQPACSGWPAGLFFFKVLLSPNTGFIILPLRLLHTPCCLYRDGCCVGGGVICLTLPLTWWMGW